MASAPSAGDDAGRPLTDHLAAVSALARSAPRRVTTVPLADAVGLILAEPATARLAVPPFANSAMDGYLVRSVDLATGPGPWTLRVAGDVPAGSAPLSPGPGEAVRIMTGSPVEESLAGRLRVIPVEQTNIRPGPVDLPDEVAVHSFVPDRRHIRPAGGNVSPGQLVVGPGARVDAGTTAALISAGVTEVSVFAAPVVAVIASGDELVEPGEVPGVGQIPDSNRPMLTALARVNGAGKVISAHAGDFPGTFADVLDRVAGEADLIVTSGGVSAGVYDVVRATTSASPRGTMWFGEVAQRPGAPQGAGTWAGVPLLCLPGNPVAAFTSFHLYVAPALGLLAGRPAPAHLLDRPRLRAVAAEQMPAPRDRTLVIPVRLDHSRPGLPAAIPFNGTAVGSHLVASLADTDGLALLAPGDDVAEGVEINVILTRS